MRRHNLGLVALLVGPALALAADEAATTPPPPIPVALLGGRSVLHVRVTGYAPIVDVPARPTHRSGPSSAPRCTQTRLLVDVLGHLGGDPPTADVLADLSFRGCVLADGTIVSLFADGGLPRVGEEYVWVVGRGFGSCWSGEPPGVFLRDGDLVATPSHGGHLREAASTGAAVPRRRGGLVRWDDFLARLVVVRWTFSPDAAPR